MKDLYIRASVRTDVWALLRRYDEALDKMSQYVSENCGVNEIFGSSVFTDSGKLETTGGGPASSIAPSAARRSRGTVA